MDAKQVDGRIKRMLGGIRQAFRGKIARTDAGSGVQRAQIEPPAKPTAAGRLYWPAIA